MRTQDSFFRETAAKKSIQHLTHNKQSLLTTQKPRFPYISTIVAMADTDIDLSKDASDNIPVATAMAVPMVQTFSTSNVMTDQSLQVLRQQGFPLGLARELGNTKATYPLRIWIVDNSGYVHDVPKRCKHCASLLALPSHTLSLSTCPASGKR